MRIGNFGLTASASWDSSWQGMHVIAQFLRNVSREIDDEEDEALPVKTLNPKP